MRIEVRCTKAAGKALHLLPSRRMPRSFTRHGVVHGIGLFPTNQYIDVLAEGLPVGSSRLPSWLWPISCPLDMCQPTEQGTPAFTVEFPTSAPESPTSITASPTSTVVVDTIRQELLITACPTTTHGSASSPTKQPLTPAQLRLRQPRTTTPPIVSLLAGCAIDGTLLLFSTCFLALGLIVRGLDGDRVSRHPTTISYLGEAIKYVSIRCFDAQVDHFGH